MAAGGATLLLRAQPLFREELGVLREALHTSPSLQVEYTRVGQEGGLMGWWMVGSSFDPQPQEYSIIAVGG